MLSLPDPFKKRVIGVHGQIGRIWLDELPTILDEFIQRWELTELEHQTDLSYNYILYGKDRSGTSVVLKIGVPHSELYSEIEALRIYDGSSLVRLLKSDPARGVLLLERLLPGKDLCGVDNDGEATRIAARLMEDFRIPDPGLTVFPTTAEWCQGFQRYGKSYPSGGPLPDDLVQRAANQANDLLSSTRNHYLLHGDLHHMNILEVEGRGWLAIDPKGVIGEPAFECGSLLLNPYPELINRPDLERIQDLRINILAEHLSLDQDRLREWSFVRAILSAIWCVEDGLDWVYPIKIAESLRKF